MIGRRRPPQSRRAFATAEVAAVAVTMGVLGTAAFVVTPRLLQAGAEEEDLTVVPRLEAHKVQTLSLLEALYRCKAVLAVQDREATPYLDVVLWAEDIVEPGVINEGEIIVLSHSTMMQSLTMHVCGLDSQEPGPPLSLRTVNEPTFGMEWRLRSDVEGRVIGSGLSQMRFSDRSGSEGQQATSAGGEGEGYLLELTWVGNRTDVADEARALVLLPSARSR